MLNKKIRSIAFHLPQYHPTVENNEWWGEGFTEWKNVATAKPLFKNHYQPHIPKDLGFYDLRLPEAREGQAALAKEYGVSGFCYYHYWFNGRRILEKPVNEILSSKKPDFPFCLCWANENWTRAWDGGAKNVLLEQHYSIEDDLNHIKYLLTVFEDERYIKIDGKPVFLIYNTDVFPDIEATVALWRKKTVEYGFKDLYLIRVESFNKNIIPDSIGFDAAVEFAPDWKTLNNTKVIGRNLINKVLQKIGVIDDIYLRHKVIEYSDMVTTMLKKKEKFEKWIRCVTPNFDNTARRDKNGLILVNSTPEKYGEWLKEIAVQTDKKFVGEERILFINAWNEWGEGNHLEPDLKWSRAYLEQTKLVLDIYNK
jgi:lipopolysaccharide biosynthesis protein